MFFKEYNKLYIYIYLIFFSQHIIMESLSLEEKNIMKDIRNLFKLKNGLNNAAIKNIRNFF